MAKLVISVLYLSTTLVAIFLLAASTGVTAKTQVEECPAIRVGTATSPQACTDMCKKKFGSLYYDSLCKIIKKKRPSNLYDVEEFKWSNLFVCGGFSKKKDKTRCPADGGYGDKDLVGASPCSSFETTASSGSPPGPARHSSASSQSSPRRSSGSSGSSSRPSSASSGSTSGSSRRSSASSGSSSGSSGRSSSSSGSSSGRSSGSSGSSSESSGRRS